MARSGSQQVFAASLDVELEVFSYMHTDEQVELPRWAHMLEVSEKMVNRGRTRMAESPMSQSWCGFFSALQGEECHCLVELG